MSSKILSATLALTIAALAGGCAGHEMIESTRRPGKYRFYSCDELTTRGRELVTREREMRTNMDKARQGTGGEIAVALAYQTEYNQTLGDLRELEAQGVEKKCTLKHRSVSDQVVR